MRPDTAKRHARPLPPSSATGHTAKIRLCSWLSLLPRKPLARHQPAKEEMNPPPALLHLASTAKPRMLPAKENLQKKGESGIQKNHSKLIIR